jgi:hypothetical protein
MFRSQGTVVGQFQLWRTWLIAFGFCYPAERGSFGEVVFAMASFPSSDRDLLAFLRAAISEIERVRGQSLDSLAEADSLMRAIKRLESPLIGQGHEQKAARYIELSGVPNDS